MGVAVSDPSVVFDLLVADTDVESATERFAALAADVVEIIHREIHSVFVDEAMWGPGVYVGELGSGKKARVWQSSLRVLDFATAARAEVAVLLDSALAVAERLGYQLKSWTLVIPADLDPAGQKAWNSWANAQKRNTGVTVDLWPARYLRRRLLSPEGVAISQLHLDAASAPAPRTVQELADVSRYDNTLFVRQLLEADIPETFAAKAAFFNAEILNRDVADKSAASELELLREWRMHVHATWSDVFNEACQISKEHVPPGVLKAVSDSIREDRAAYSSRMNASTIHGVGIMHQAVEAGDAGWVRDWRRVADEHNQGRSAPKAGHADGGV